MLAPQFFSRNTKPQRPEKFDDQSLGEECKHRYCTLFPEFVASTRTLTDLNKLYTNIAGLEKLRTRYDAVDTGWTDDAYAKLLSIENKQRLGEQLYYLTINTAGKSAYIQLSQQHDRQPEDDIAYPRELKAITRQYSSNPHLLEQKTQELRAEKARVQSETVQRFSRDIALFEKYAVPGSFVRNAYDAFVESLLTIPAPVRSSAQATTSTAAAPIATANSDATQTEADRRERQNRLTFRLSLIDPGVLAAIRQAMADEETDRPDDLQDTST